MTKSSTALKSLLLLDSDKFVWYQDGMTNALSVAYPADSVKHLEIINRTAIIDSVKNFIAQNKIPTWSIVAVLTTRTLFIQDIQKDPDEKNNAAAQDTFLGMVPFEEVVYTTIQGPKAFKLIAANQEFTDVFKDTFTGAGFAFECASPVALAGEQYASLNSLDIPTAKAILSSLEALKKHALLPIKKVIEEPRVTSQQTITQVVNPGETTKPNNTRTYIMLGVLGILLVILGFVVYFNVIAPPATPKKQSTPAAAVPNTTPPPVISDDITTPASSSANFDPSTLTVQILYSGTASSITPLRNELEDIGFETIITRNAGATPGQNTQMILSGNVPVTLRDNLVQILNDQYESVVVQTAASPQYDISITTGLIQSSEEE